MFYCFEVKGGCHPYNAYVNLVYFAFNYTTLDSQKMFDYGYC